MRRFACVLMLLWLSTSAGCAMCSSCDDYNYAAYGGRWQRDDPVNGRVGSVFAPAGAMVIGETVLADEAPAAESGEEPDAEEVPAEESEQSLLQAGEAAPQTAPPPGDEEATDDLTGISLPLFPPNAPVPGQRSILNH